MIAGIAPITVGPVLTSREPGIRPVKTGLTNYEVIRGLITRNASLAAASGSFTLG